MMELCCYASITTVEAPVTLETMTTTATKTKTREAAAATVKTAIRRPFLNRGSTPTFKLQPTITTDTSSSITTKSTTRKSRTKSKYVDKDENADNNLKEILTITAAGIIIIVLAIFLAIYVRRKMNPDMGYSTHKAARRRRSVSSESQLSGKSALNKLPVENPLPPGGPERDANVDESVPKYKAPKPKKMKAAELDYKRTKQAALVMRKAYKGEVKHELQDDESKALSGIEFDPKQDSIAYIGTHVEKIEGTTILTDQQSTFAPSKMAHKTTKSSHQKSRHK